MNSRRAKNWREQLRATLVQEPSLISLTLRWFGWFVALAIYFLNAAPTVNLENTPPVLVVTSIHLFLMSLYPRHIRGRLSKKLSQKVPALWPALDGVIAIWSIYQTGGWDSPFYHYGVTVVLAPSLQFGLLGALLSSTAFSIAFMIVVTMTEQGFSPAYAGNQAEPDLVSSPLNPLMIALYAAFLREVLKKLRREMERSKILAAENERARMAADIHDGVSQTLFMLSMSLETGKVLAQKEKADKTAVHLEKLVPVAQKALVELRNAMYSVEPLAEGKQTLAEAVTQLARDYRSATGKDVECCSEDGFSCSTQLSSELFRMTQEALSNACQHSGGDKIKVLLSNRSIQVVDNGKGFDRASIKPGRGLGNLEKRAHERGIALELSSGDEGTTVTFTWNEDEP